MPTFKAPTYSKKVNSQTGQVEPSYVFGVEFLQSDETLSFVADQLQDISLSTLQKCVIENHIWWNGFMSAFLKSSAKLFSKPYTVEHINKITKHSLHGTAQQHEFPSTVNVLPTSIEISGGVFLIHWSYACEPIVIDIVPIPDSECPVLNEVVNGVNHVINGVNHVINGVNPVMDGVEELSIENVPMDNNATGDTLTLDSPEKFYDRQRVKEARLKAKLAMYKVQNQMAKYYEKYGTEVTDSDTEDEEEEEIQL